MKVFGIGTFGKDPEIKTVGAKETALCSFSLASTRKFKDADGERITDWLNCVAWGKTAEIIAKFFHKGSKIMIEGELQTRNYEGKDGKKVYVTEINVSDFEFIDAKKDSDHSEPKAPPIPEPAFYPAMDDSSTALPFDL